jgi:hypothetical protein
MAWTLWGNQVSIQDFRADIAEGVVWVRLTVDKPMLAHRLFHQLGWESSLENGPFPIPASQATESPLTPTGTEPRARFGSVPWPQSDHA